MSFDSLARSLALEGQKLSLKVSTDYYRWINLFLIIYFSRFYQISSGLGITFQHLHHSITPIRIKRDRQMSKDRFRSTRATIIPMRMAVFQKSIRNKRL